MATNTKQVTYRKDYKKPNFNLVKTELEFDLDEINTIVTSALTVNNNKDNNFILNGSKFLNLESILINGEKPEYEIDENNNLIIKNAPVDFQLQTKVKINPSENTTCMGLYMSDGMFTTQCEAEGFRNITYYPDRPDVLSMFKVTIRADKDKYNAWLSNGNNTFQRELGDGKIETVWEDPFPKASYLFALVVGNLGHIQDEFITMSGRKVDLHLYCDNGKEDKLQFAMTALKTSMKWDEEKFGREYDLDIFNIVAVSSFVFGAMENKSLNIFNDVALLADKDSATDANFQNIMGIIAHEYFHNWSGNRVSLQNWFELSLKEGFTVYRDHLFSADQYSKITQRIDNVSYLRTAQFAEDNGPLSHPVRAEEYIAIDNFYTATVYEKGGEIIRMYETILGWDNFRKGCDLYFDRFDGQAVSIDDFASCMEEVSGQDLTQFKRWYTQNGTPTVIVETDFSDDIFTVRLKQTQEKFNDPLVIPLEFGLLDASGKEIKSGMMMLDSKEKTFNFDGIDNKPVLSLNRGFSAPVVVDIEYSEAEKEVLIKHDTDLFNRFDNGQKYAVDMILQDRIDKDFISIFGSYLDLFGNDNEYVSQAITLPSTSYVSQFISEIDYDRLLDKRKKISIMFAEKHQNKLLQIYKHLDTNKTYSIDPQDMADRSLKLGVLHYLCLTDKGKDLAIDLYEKADNLTEKTGALACLRHADIGEFDKYMSDFYNHNKDNHLVVLKWLSLEASTEREDIIPKMKSLLEHEAFDIKNPNKVRYLISSFTQNLRYFHAKDGSGYKFMSEAIKKVDKVVPTTAAGLATAFKNINKVDNTRKELMTIEIEDILETNISSSTREILEKILPQKQLSSLEIDRLKKEKSR